MKKGYIEGYYGRLFSKEEREMVLNHMGKLKMDFYIYGPKEDPYHRLNWQKLYPKKQCNELKALLRSSNKNKIKPVFALSPGMSMDAGSKDDIKSLQNKINQAKKLGFRHFAIFFDDLDQKKDQKSDAIWDGFWMALGPILERFWAQVGSQVEAMLQIYEDKTRIEIKSDFKTLLGMVLDRFWLHFASPNASLLAPFWRSKSIKKWIRNRNALKVAPRLPQDRPRPPKTSTKTPQKMISNRPKTA